MATLPLGQNFAGAQAASRSIHPTELSKEDLLDAEFEFGKVIINSSDADIFGHPLGMSLGIHDHCDFDMLEELIRLSSQSQIAFEFSSKYHSKILKDILSLLSRYNPHVSLGSDAHQIERVGECQRVLREHVHG